MIKKLLPGLGQWQTQLGVAPDPDLAESALRGAIEFARSALRRGRWDVVADRLEPLVTFPCGWESGPGPASRMNAMASLLYGRARMELGQHPSGRPFLENAIGRFAAAYLVTSPADPDDVADHAAALRSLGRVAEAVPALRRSMKTDDTVPWRLRLELGQALYLAGESDEAETHLQSALMQKPAEPATLSQLAACRVRQNRTHEASRHYLAASVGFAAGNDYRDAIDCAHRALDLRDQDAQTWSVYAELMLALRRLPDAVDAAYRAIGLDDDMASAHATCSVALLLSGDYSTGLAHAERAHELAPANIAAILVHAAALAASGRPDAALSAVNAANTVAPEVPAVGLIRGELLLGLGAVREAEQVLRRVAEIDPNNGVALAALGRALHRLDQPEEGLDLLSQAADLEPDDVETRVFMADALLALDRVDEAAEAAAEVLAAQPDNAVALGVRGRAVLEQDNAAEAVELLQRALAVDPDLADDLRTSLGRALVELGRYDEGIATLREALGAHEDDSIARVALAGALHFTEHEEEAAHLLLGDQSWHGHPDGHAVLGETLARLNRKEEALEELDRARDLMPHWSDVQAVRGQVLQALGRLPEAEAALRAALEANADDAQTRALLGVVLRDQHRPEEALAELRQAVELRPEEFSWRADLADLLWSVGRADDAMSVADEGLLQDPAAAGNLALKGQLLRQHNRLNEAIPYLINAIAADPELTWPRLEYAFVLGSLRRGEEALEIVDKMLDEDRDNGSVWETRATVLANLGRYSETIEALDKAMALLGENGFRLSLKANAQSMQAHWDEAVANFEKSIELDRDPWALARLGGLLLDREDPPLEGVLILLREAVEQDLPFDPLAHIRYGDALRLANRDDEAASQYRAVIENGNRNRAADPDALHEIAWAHLMLGNVEKAIRRLLKVVDLDPANTNARFDLGLAMLHVPDHPSARMYYEEGVRQVGALEVPGEREKLLLMARVDLSRAARSGDLPDEACTLAVSDIRKLLDAAWKNREDAGALVELVAAPVHP